MGSGTSSSRKNTTKLKKEGKTDGINEDTQYVNASDTIHDNPCTVCERKGRNSEAVVFCESCTKYYCVPCRDAHDRIQDDHEIYGTDRMDKWQSKSIPSFEVSGKKPFDRPKYIVPENGIDIQERKTKDVRKKKSKVLHKQKTKDYVYKVASRNEFTIKEKSDDKDKLCDVRSMCCFPNGNVIISDFTNKKIKLFDKRFKFISSHSLELQPSIVKLLKHDIIAVSCYSENEIFVFTVKQDTFEEINHFWIRHTIIHFDTYNGLLCIATGQQLCLYTEKGKLIEILHSKENLRSMQAVAIDKISGNIFVVNNAESCVLTLNSEGKELHVLSDGDLSWPEGICHDQITQTTFVCDYISNTIIQISSDGREKLSTLKTSYDLGSSSHGLNSPVAVKFNNRTSQLLVAQKDTDELVVFQLE